MNIIIPLAGRGERFKQDGYTMPKPLIQVHGEPLIFHVLRSLGAVSAIPDGGKMQISNDTIYIPYSAELDQYGFKYIVNKQFENIQFIPLNFPTRGPVETVFCALQKISNLNQPTLIADGDTFYDEDIIEKANNFESNNAIFYFETQNEPPIFSYIKGDHGKVTEIKEKVKISDFACTGAYLFRDGHTLKKYAEIVLQSNKTTNGEYYISSIYHYMLDAETIFYDKIQNFHCLGTPQQLKSYCMREASAYMPQKRFCFDLDGTLCTFPETPGDYSTVKPIAKNIAKLNHLHSLGHTIIIQTARGMASCNNNVGAATVKNQLDILEFLHANGINYHEIYFGKPHAHFYIDDLAIPAHSDLDKALGFYDGKVEPRHFNKIEYEGNTVLKTCSNPGEIYWYNNIPSEIKQHFPKVILSPTDNKANTIRLEKINGVPFSYLMVNGSLTTADIDLLFETIDKIHNVHKYDPKPGGPEENNVHFWSNVQRLPYQNYAKKVQDRFSAHQDIYAKVTDYSDYTNVFEQIIDFLQQYETDKLAIPGVIHGDPVFSNIFMCDNRQLKFIDMRGRQGNSDTIYGDILYDFSKIHQSLNDYDFIMTDVNINFTYQTKLRQHFESLFIFKFGLRRMEILKMITASHFFSLIPLHNDLEKQKKYFQCCVRLLESNSLYL